MAAGDVDQRIRDIQREYAEFLDDYVIPVDFFLIFIVWCESLFVF